MQLGILFWFYRDVVVCETVRLLRHRNPGVPVYGLYGGPRHDEQRFRAELAPLLDDFWSYPDDRDEVYKWRHGDIMLSRWFTERGATLEWDSVFLAQWDLVVVSSLATCCAIRVGDMLISGVRPVREVEAWWQWTRGEARAEYDAFLALVAARYGPVEDPMCCQFIGMVAPRTFLDRYGGIEEPELGFLEYKVPVYAQAFGVPLVADTCFRPWWPEEPATSGAAHRDTRPCLAHAGAAPRDAVRVQGPTRPPHLPPLPRHLSP